MYDLAQTQIAASTSLDDNERITMPMTAGQQIYLRVTEFSGFFTGEYDLKLTFITPDAREANNTAGTANVIGSGDVTINNLNIHDATDVDFFRWTAPTSGKVTVDANFSAFDGDLAIELFDSTGTTSLTSANGNTGNERMTYNVTAGTQYLIRVREALSDVHPSYQLVVNHNSLPTISDIPTTSGYIGGTTSIPFTVSDVETPLVALVLTASSSNPSLIPNSNISFSGSGTNRTIHLLGTPGNFGSAVITVNVMDGDGDIATDTFNLNVFLTNAPPTITDISNS